VPLRTELQKRKGVSEETAGPRPMAGGRGFESVFLTDEWRCYVEQVFGHAYFPLHLALASGTRVDILSYDLPRRLGLFHVLYSTPPYYYGGLSADRPLEDDELAEVFERVRRQCSVHSLTIAFHPLDPLSQVRFPGIDRWVLSESSTHVLDLSTQRYAGGDESFSKNQRKKLRKALRRGVTVVRDDDPAAVEQYYRIYLDSAARWGLDRVESLESLLALQRHLKPYFALRLALVSGRVVAGLIVLTYRDVVFAMHGASLSDCWDLFPNNLLHSDAISAASAEGRRYFDFLPSARLAGVEAFKESFGAQKLRFNVYRIPGRLYSGFATKARRVLGG
jgi:hypothetical protein